jgi:hypothetical protein
VFGVAFYYAIAHLLLMFPSIIIPYRLVNLQVSAVIKAILPSAICSILMYLIVVSVQSFLPGGSVYSLLLLGTLAVGAYAVISGKLNHSKLSSLYSFAYPIIQRTL